VVDEVVMFGRRRLSPEEQELREKEKRLQEEIKLMNRINRLEERKEYFKARHEANMEAVVRRAKLDAENIVLGTKPSGRGTKFLSAIQWASKYYRLPPFSSMSMNTRPTKKQEEEKE
jgi:hypothetical protein